MLSFRGGMYSLSPSHSESQGFESEVGVWAPRGGGIYGKLSDF